MSFINVHRDQHETHIHITHKNLFLLTLLLLIAIVAVGTIVAYHLLIHKSLKTASFYDSSVGKTELQDFNPPPPPSDVRSEIQVLDATKPSQIPIPAKTIPAQASNAAMLSPTLSPNEVRVPIIMYHYVEYVQDKNDKTRLSLDTTPATLENEIQTLQNAGYTFMTNNDLSDVLDNKSTLPSNPILLTFDDGYRDFYTDAYPILKKYHVKATNYVIAGFLNKPNHMLSSQVQEIANDGLVEIAAHTLDHIALGGIKLRTVSYEVFQSRETLEQLIHKPVLSFAYPFGSFDDQAIQVVKDAGFRSAVSTLPGVNQSNVNRYFMFRLRPGGRIGQAFLDYINQTKF